MPAGMDASYLDFCLDLSFRDVKKIAKLFKQIEIKEMDGIRQINIDLTSV